MDLKDQDILAQSKIAYNQWAKQWREHAKHHSRFQMKDMLALQNIGVGKACLVIANGYSFEKNLETIKKHQHNVDILCVDKCLANCIEHGIIPTYTLVCDANVSFEKYMQPVAEKLGKTTLLMNVCGNPAWSGSGNWKEIYFFVNKDSLHSEREFAEISGCDNLIVAGTNVSNAAIVALTQCDERGRRNFFGYDKLLMIGFDYCWGNESYYAFNRDGGGKRHYMKTVYGFTVGGETCFSSPNLLFSAKWIEKYIGFYKVPAIQCSKDSLVRGYKVADLAEQMQYRYKPEDAKAVIDLLNYRRQREAEIVRINEQIHGIGREHYKALIRTT